MTSRERLLAALRKQQPDRVPMTLRMWKFLRKHYPDFQDPLDKHFRAQEEFGIDLWHDLLSPPLPCFYPAHTHWRDDVQVEVKQVARGNRNYWERTIHTPGGDLHDVKQALIITEGSGDGPEIMEPLVKDFRRDLPLIRFMQADPVTMNLEAALQKERRLEERGLGIANMYSPLDCRDVMRQPDLLMLYYDDREAFREIVEIGAEAMMRETRYVLEAGFKVILAWWFYTSPSAGWSPQIYEEMFLPHLVKHIELVHQYDALYIYYDDGKMGRFIDFYVDSGADCLMTLTPPPMGDAVPERVKGEYGDRVGLIGGIDVVNEVYLSTPTSIRQMVKDRLAVYKPGGGYIMDGSNSLVYETPVENVRALAEAGLEFGVY